VRITQKHLPYASSSKKVNVSMPVMRAPPVVNKVQPVVSKHPLLASAR
jgi:hypothetical protein